MLKTKRQPPRKPLPRRNLPPILYSVCQMANSTQNKVIINERAAARLRGGHAWVYASDVLNDAGVQPGSVVTVVGPKSKILGSAIYSSSSQIKLRLLGREALRSEEELLQLVGQRLAEAVAYRSKVVQKSDACRLVFSEADRLPGLMSIAITMFLPFRY